MNPPSYTEAEKAAVYRVIRERRDVRTGYLPTQVDDLTLQRLLSAAHQAPSVGFMQPWRFIIIRDASLRAAVHSNFLRANAAAAQNYSDDRRELYTQLRLEGLLEAPQHICVVCESGSQRGHGLGRHSMPATAAYSAACAIQNLWLAARAEGIGLGWVSILNPSAVRSLLRIPADVDLVAYLCLGYVEQFAHTPDLEHAGWEHRADLAPLVHADFFDQPFRFTKSSEE